MKMKKTLSFFALICVLTSCNPKVTTQIVKSFPDAHQAIDVIELDQEVPQNAQIVGRIKIGDTGFTTNCDYSYVLELAKKEAEKNGGNAIKITEHEFPNLISTCHRISAVILRIEKDKTQVFLSNEPAQNSSVSDNASTTENHYMKAPTDNRYMNNSSKVYYLITGGYSNRLSPLSPTLPMEYVDHTKKLKHGYHIGFDFCYYFSDNWGLGIKSNLFKTNKSSNTSYRTMNLGHSSFMKNEHTIPFIGLLSSSRFTSPNKKNVFLLNYSFGYLGYTDKCEAPDHYKITGKTLGCSLGFNYSYWFSKNVAIDLGMNVIFGTLSKCTIQKGPSIQEYRLVDNNREGLSRLDLSLGFRFGH